MTKQYKHILTEDRPYSLSFDTVNKTWVMLQYQSHCTRVIDIDLEDALTSFDWYYCNNESSRNSGKRLGSK